MAQADENRERTLLIVEYGDVTWKRRLVSNAVT